MDRQSNSAYKDPPKVGTSGVPYSLYKEQIQLPTLKKAEAGPAEFIVSILYAESFDIRDT